MAFRAALGKAFDAYGEAGTSTLHLAAAIALFYAARENDYAIKPMFYYLDGYLRDDWSHNWGCTVDMLSVVGFSRFVSVLLLFSSLIAIVLATFLSCTTNHVRHTRPLLWVLWRSTIVVLASLGYFTLIVKTGRPTVDIDPSLLGEASDVRPGSSKYDKLLMICLDTFSQPYSNFAKFDHALIIMWGALSLLLLANASASATLRDRGVKLPTSFDETTTERVEMTQHELPV